MAKSRTIKVDYLARVEGEGSLYIRYTGDRVADVKLKIFEPPRLFEGILRGRNCREVPDITARICGICPVAYQITSIEAIEGILGITPDEGIRQLRRLMYCGEWIESHALHIYMLHAPDFLGVAGVAEIARDHSELVEAALALKKLGNDIVALVGGREIHPINACIGGFYRIPATHEILALKDRLLKARDTAIETCRWAATLPFPAFETDYEFVALSKPGEYPLDAGNLISSRGLNIPVDAYQEHFIERQVSYSNALQSVLRGRGAYLVGPLARFNLNFEQLPESVRNLAVECGAAPPVTNMFRSIVIRAIETVFACEEALRLIGNFEPPEHASVAWKPRAGVGHAITEAPRGILYHRYELDKKGDVISARIIPPTAQNQKQIEEDLTKIAANMATEPLDAVTRRCEQTVRNYDPCISCATHFLKIDIDRT